jgi:hypothetical protein
MSKLHNIQPNSQYSPATWPKRHGKYHRYQKDEENTTNAISNSPAIRILRIKHRFTTQSKRDGHCSKEHGLSTANTIENENHKDEIGERVNTIINACDKRAATACNTKGFIHDGLVVPNHINTGHLRKYLDSNAMSAEADKFLISGIITAGGMHIQESSPPLRNCKHSHPSRCSDIFLCLDGGTDPAILGLDPGIIQAIGV